MADQKASEPLDLDDSSRKVQVVRTEEGWELRYLAAGKEPVVLLQTRPNSPIFNIVPVHPPFSLQDIYERQGIDDQNLHSAWVRAREQLEPWLETQGQQYLGGEKPRIIEFGKPNS